MMRLDKPQIIAMHEQEFESWERLLAGLSDAQRADPTFADGLSIKDTLAHLAAWQQRTIARLEAGVYDHAVRFPDWPIIIGEVETPEIVDEANAWIFETHRDQAWSDVYPKWRAGYLRFLELLRLIPETELRPDGKFPWLAEYQPLEEHPEVYDYHHAEHRVQLEAWLRHR